MEQIGMPGITVINGLMLTIRKCDNGFMVNLLDPPKPPPRKKGQPVPEEETLDGLISGMVQFNRMMNAANNEGESWKRGSRDDAPDPKKLREAFRHLFPGLVARATDQREPEPKMESLVFGSKKELITFLTRRL